MAEAISLKLNIFFWISLLIASLGWFWQVLRLRDPKLPNREYGKMFSQNVGIGFLILLGMILGST